MSVKSRTIDNLGIESSRRYAQDVEGFDAKLIQDSKLAPIDVGVTTSEPYAQSLFDVRYSLPRQIPLALFSPPPGEADPAGLFFKNGLLPQDFYETRDALLDKLTRFKETLNTLPSSTIEEFNKIEGGIDTKEKLTRTWELIKSRCNWFTRG